MSEYYYEENEQVDTKKIGIVIAIIAIVVITALIYFGVIPLNFKVEEPVIETPVIEEQPVEIPEVIKEVEENPIFISSSKEGLLPTTPQNFDNTPNTESLEPVTPQYKKPVQSGNLDDINSQYRRFIESGYTVDEILYIQNTPCSEIPIDDITTYHDIIGVKGC